MKRRFHREVVYTFLYLNNFFCNFLTQSCTFPNTCDVTFGTHLVPTEMKGNLVAKAQREISSVGLNIKTVYLDFRTMCTVSGQVV